MQKSSLSVVKTLFKTAFSAFTAFVLLFVSSACQKQQEETFPSGAVRVKVPQYQNNQISLVPITLYSIDNISTLSGWAAQFIMSPGSRNGELFGREPKINTIRNAQGEYIATDTFSLELLSLYANLEKLAFFDVEVGANDLIKRPLKVGVRSQIVNKYSQRIEKDQAMYSAEHDALFFVPSQEARLPLGMNSGVIAHEYFHALFDKMMPSLKLNGSARTQEERCKKINDPSDQEIYRIRLLRAFNEGLADVWGFLFSSDADFVSRSLPKESSRDLSTSRGGLMNKEQFQNEIRQYECFYFSKKSNLNYVYRLGSQVARPIVHYTLSQMKEKGLTWEQARVKTASAIIRSIKKYAITMSSSNRELTPRDIHQLLQQELDGFTVHE